MTTKTPSKLEKILSEGHLAVTSECGPPRGSNSEHIIKKGELIKIMWMPSISPTTRLP